jgi:hypothetical protein
MTTCSSCNKPKANYQCGICEDDLCKNCTEFLEEGAFSFYKNTPVELTHTAYCDTCFHEHVTEARVAYNDLMAKAKEVFIFSTAQKKHIPILKRARERIEVKNCDDKEEIVMRLAFLAAEENYNGVIEVDVKTTKVINGGYQKSVYNASGIPALIDEVKLTRQVHE